MAVVAEPLIGFGGFTFSACVAVYRALQSVPVWLLIADQSAGVVD